MLCVCVSIGAWAAKISDSGNGTYEVSNGVVTFSNTTAGEIATNFNNLTLGNATQVKFDNTCEISKADLECFFTLYGNPVYYIDLFDITNGDGAKMSISAIDVIITEAVNDMKTDERDMKAKGLIIPFNSTIGTSDAMGKTVWENATFSDYVAYYRESETAKNLVLYVYDTGSAATSKYSNAVNQLKTHEEIEQAWTVLVSTNTGEEFDMSSLTAKKVKIEITNDDMVNTSTGQKANIYAVCSVPGGFAEHISTTGTKNTPTDILKISGELSQDDVKAVNYFTAGPRVLDLRDAVVQGTGITKALLEAITNSSIEYILLPEGMSKDIVCGANYSSKMSSLKAVISSSNTNLVAHVAQAGSLAEARYLATGGTAPTVQSPYFSPSITGLQSVVLSGNLNAADIAANPASKKVDENGHWYTPAQQNAENQASLGLNGEQMTITSIDLERALFDIYHKDDMNFSYAGFATGNAPLAHVTLPTADSMDLIPENCFYGCQSSLTELHIPYNYTHFGNAAFCGSCIDHITTTDASGAIIDNGPKTYTFSAHLQEIGTNPATTENPGASLAESVFPQNRGVTDIYVLATTVPLCYKGAFPASDTYGWGGFRGADTPYCREKYDNSPKDDATGKTTGTQIFTVLHYPHQGNMTDDEYEAMEKLYTDITKVYTKREQTGAVDANGREILWPTFSELRRVYNQASASVSWNEWVANYDGSNEVNGGDHIPLSPTEIPDKYNSDGKQGKGNTDKGSYTFNGYEGWHQIVLAMATYVEPTKNVTRYYEEAGWFTFCIPFDMTLGEVINLMGVPASDDANKITNMIGEEKITFDRVPDIRQLRSVQRIQGDATHNNKVIFRLTTDLYRGGVDPKYLTFNFDSQPADRVSETSTVPSSGTHIDKNQRLLMGGQPYIIKAYKRVGEKIPSQNLGQYVMDHYGNKFKAEQSCIYHSNFEQLGNDPDVITLRFAKPYENHKIQAAGDADTTDENWQATSNWLTYKDGTTDRPYYYTLVGQFWEQKLPRYCFYLSKGVWYRNSGINNYTWQPYKCVIMATPYQNDSFGEFSGSGFKSGKYRDLVNSKRPTISNGTDLLEGDDLEIRFLDGRDDDDFPKPTGAKYTFCFDDDIMEIGDEIDVTSIDCLDGESVETAMPTNGKVYNMAGQYVGSSLEGLGKGLYIVNGKKYVVK